MPFKDTLLDELLKEYKSPEDLIGKDGMLKQLTKQLDKKAMESELTHHLGYEKNAQQIKILGIPEMARPQKTSRVILGRPAFFLLVRWRQFDLWRRRGAASKKLCETD